MNKILEQSIKKSKVGEMKSPVILMNTDDLKSFTDELKDQIIGFDSSDKPKYRGIPIEVSEFAQMGEVLIYDNVFNFFK
jgi:glutaredoxin-related protein